MSELRLTTVPRDLYYHEAAYVRRLEAALRDIASSEPIPTPIKGWEFCRDIARAALTD